MAEMPVPDPTGLRGLEQTHYQILQGLRSRVLAMRAEIDVLKAATSKTTSATALTASAGASMLERIAALERAQRDAGTPRAPLLIQAAQDIDPYTVVAQDASGLLVPADITVVDHFGDVVGMTRTAVPKDALADVARHGDVVDNVDWSWTPGDALWAGADGAVATSRGSGQWAQIVAVAATAKTVVVVLEPAVLRVAGTAKALTAETDGRFRELALSPHLTAPAGGLSASVLVAENSSGVAVAADIGDPAQIGKIVGITRAAASAAAPVEVARNGEIITDVSWTWTPGQILWASATAGGLATSRGNGEFSQRVGFALSATSVLVLLGEPIQRDDSVLPAAILRALTSDPDGMLIETALLASLVSNDSTVSGDTVKDALSNLNTRLTAAEADIDALQAWQTTAQATLDDHEARITALENP